MRDKTSSIEMLAAEAADTDGVSLDDFYAYMPMHTYIYAPSREMWPASSVNARIPPIPRAGRQSAWRASAWLDQQQAGRADDLGARPADADPRPPDLGRRLDRAQRGDAASTCTGRRRSSPATPPKPGRGSITCARSSATTPTTSSTWLAHRVQRPQEKINHALVLGGAQGIGKDTLLEPVKHAVGPWNFAEVSPQHMLGRFNGFLKSVILRVSEARDLGDVNRFQFYDHMKAYTAAPPDVLRVDEKNLREHSVLNCCGVDHHHQPQDRRHLPAGRRSPALRRLVRTNQGRLRPDYWNKLWRWYASGGDRARRRLSRRARPLRLRPQGAAAEDAGLLGHRRRQPRARGRRTRRRPRQTRQRRTPRRSSAISNAGRRRLRDLDQGPQEPPRHPAPARKVRLRPGPQRRRRRRALEDQRQAPGDLRKKRAADFRTAQGSQAAADHRSRSVR